MVVSISIMIVITLIIFVLLQFRLVLVLMAKSHDKSGARGENEIIFAFPTSMLIIAKSERVKSELEAELIMIVTRTRT